MKETPITVLMTVRDGMPGLPAAVQSILGQSFSEFEFLIIDDHSSDGSADYLKSLEDARVRILTNPGAGLTDGLNFGLTQAKGEWIARMDADDWSFPQRLSRQWEVSRRPRTILVSADYLLCDENFNSVGEIRLCPPNPKLLSYLRRKNNPFCHPVMMFQRRAALVAGSYRYERAQDYDLWIRLLEKGELAHVEEALLKYRVRRGAVSINHLEEQSQVRAAIHGRRETQSVSSSRRRVIAGQYAYRLGFGAWLAGKRAEAFRYFAGSLVQGHRGLQCLGAMLLSVFPKSIYLSLAGYKGVYR